MTCLILKKIRKFIWKTLDLLFCIDTVLKRKDKDSALKIRLERGRQGKEVMQKCTVDSDAVQR